MKIREIAPTVCFQIGIWLTIISIVTGSARVVGVALLFFAFPLADINDRGWVVQNKVIPPTPVPEEE